MSGVQAERIEAARNSYGHEGVMYTVRLARGCHAQNANWRNIAIRFELFLVGVVPRCSRRRVILTVRVRTHRGSRTPETVRFAASWRKYRLRFTRAPRVRT